MIHFGIIRFSSVNDTEASVFGYSVFTRFDRPLLVIMFVCFSNQTQLVLLPLSCQYLISQPYQMHFLMVKGMLASYCHRDDEVIKVVI